MANNWRKVCILILVGMLLFLPFLNAAGEQTILSQEEYDEQFQVYLETHVATPELVSAWEEGLIQYPENNQLRYYLIFAYSRAGQADKAKACAKEALLYEPDSIYFANTYLVICSMGDDLNETQEAAEYVLDITLPLLPPAGQLVNQHEMQDIQNYPYLEYCMNATLILQSIYTEQGDEAKMHQYSDWILRRRNDSDSGYEFGLLSMFSLAVYYGKAGRFNEMAYWLDQYFTLEATAAIKGEDWTQKQERLRPGTDLSHEIYNAYQEQGDKIDIYSFLKLDTSQ